MRHATIGMFRFGRSPRGRLTLIIEMPAPKPSAGTEDRKDYRDWYEHLTGVSLKVCPLCGTGTMVVIETLQCTTGRVPVMDTS